MRAVCQIDLQAGETIVHMAVGAKEGCNRYLKIFSTKRAYSQIIIKPFVLGETNLMVTTDRRTYNIFLIGTEEHSIYRTEFTYANDGFNFVPMPKKAATGLKPSNSSSVPRSSLCFKREDNSSFSVVRGQISNLTLIIGLKVMHLWKPMRF